MTTELTTQYSFPQKPFAENAVTEEKVMKTDSNVPNVGIVSADMGELNIIHSDQIRDIIENLDKKNPKAIEKIDKQLIHIANYCMFAWVQSS